MITFLSDGPNRSPAALLLAHGAGAPMTSPFLEEMAALVAARGVRVLRFEFGYMASRRRGGARRPPPRAELLAPEFLLAAAEARARLGRGHDLIIGCKSMGGRVASLVADELWDDGAIRGLVCLGYPFHPRGKPEGTRTLHLAALRCRTLIVQGASDPLGSRAEVEGYALSPSISVHWIAGADHDLAVRGQGHEATERARLEAARALSGFVDDMARAAPAGRGLKPSDAGRAPRAPRPRR